MPFKKGHKYLDIKRTKLLDIDKQLIFINKRMSTSENNTNLMLYDLLFYRINTDYLMNKLQIILAKYKKRNEDFVTEPNKIMRELLQEVQKEKSRK